MMERIKMQADFQFTAASSDSPISAYSFEGAAVRVLMMNDAPWFALVDVCRVLEHSNPTMAARRLDPDEKMTLNSNEGHLLTLNNSDAGGRGGARSISVVNESGLHNLIFSSNKPAAKRFRKWVTSEVLPSIRRTGSYHVARPIQESAPALSMAEMTLAVISDLQKQVETHKLQIAEHLDTIASHTELLNYSMPRAAIHDRLIYADGTLTLSDAAKTIGVAPRKFMALLRREGWLFRRGKSPLAAYQDKIKSGYLTHKVSVILAPDGEERMTEQVRVTSKGLAKLARLAPASLRANADVSMPAPVPSTFAGHRVEDGTRARYRRDAERRELQRLEEFEAYQAESEKHRTEYY
ncbi:BRO family protein [Acetobacter sp.]|uniref:BRO family protein n=1 Tax=Acetobacter sp. TaxID=440 RepID=UPI0039EA6301